MAHTRARRASDRRAVGVAGASCAAWCVLVLGIALPVMVMVCGKGGVACARPGVYCAPARCQDGVRCGVQARVALSFDRLPPTVIPNELRSEGSREGETRRERARPIVVQALACFPEAG